MDTVELLGNLADIAELESNSSAVRAYRQTMNVYRDYETFLDPFETLYEMNLWLFEAGVNAADEAEIAAYANIYAILNS